VCHLKFENFKFQIRIANCDGRICHELDEIDCDCALSTAPRFFFDCTECHGGISSRTRHWFAATRPAPEKRLHRWLSWGYGLVFLDVLEFFLSAGPPMVFWGLILYWPARWAWQRGPKSKAQSPVNA